MPHFIAFITTFLVALAAVGVVNVWANLGHMFRADYAVEERVARLIDDGQYVRGNQEFDIPAAQIALIDRQRQAPDGVVFGSSRSMQIAARHFGGGRLLNHAVDTALLETHLGLFARYESRDLVPKSIILGLDPWIFKNAADDPALRLIAADLHAFSEKLGVKTTVQLSDRRSRLAELFSLPRFWAALSRRDGDCHGLWPAKDAASHCAIRGPDMSLKYPLAWQTRGADMIADEVALSLSRRGRMHGFRGFDRIEPGQVDALRRFLAYLQSKKIRTVVFLAPYHPLVAERRRGHRDWALVTAAESTIRAVTRELAISVVGSFDPRRAVCTAAEFFDRLHARPVCIDRILAPLASTVR